MWDSIIITFMCAYSMPTGSIYYCIFISVRTCFVTSLNRATQLDTLEPPPDVVYREGGTDTFCIPGKVREAVHEVLFEQDNDQTSISTMILDAIIKAKYLNSIALTSFISKLSLLLGLVFRQSL